MGGRLITGFLIDRISAPYVTAVIFTFVAAGCLALGVGGISYAFIAAIALGFAVGAEVDRLDISRLDTLTRELRDDYGVQYSVFSLGAGISPVLAGYIWDVNGNYDVPSSCVLSLLRWLCFDLTQIEDVAEQDPAVKHA